MEKEPKIENKEFFERAELTIVPKHADKNFMVSFEARNEIQNNVYNSAIEEVCLEQKLNPFHQVGSQEKLGYQAWEMWAKIDKEQLEKLLPEIHAKAKQIYQRDKELGILG